MKIYNKKTFAFGVFSAALGVLNAVTAALRGIDAAGVVLVAVLLFVGAGAMMRGLSQKMAREDKLEERDERNPPGGTEKQKRGLPADAACALG